MLFCIYQLWYLKNYPGCQVYDTGTTLESEQDPELRNHLLLINLVMYGY